MTTQEFEIKATENVREIINYISKKEYSKLHTITNINSSWCSDGETQIEGMKSFCEWLTDQLEIWSEDEEKEFVIDKFDKEFVEINVINSNYAFAIFKPKSNGEEIDLWFEIKFTINENNQLSSEFDVNI